MNVVLIGSLLSTPGVHDPAGAAVQLAPREQETVAVHGPDTERGNSGLPAQCAQTHVGVPPVSHVSIQTFYLYNVEYSPIIIRSRFCL